MSNLKIFGFGAAGGTLGILVLGGIVLLLLGFEVYAAMLFFGVLIFVLAGAAVLVMKATGRRSFL